MNGCARIELREVDNAEPELSPLEIWCNEAQERYVLAIKPEGLRRVVLTVGSERPVAPSSKRTS